MAEDKPKVVSVCIDTLTTIQENQYMEDSRKPGFDQWLDYGKNIYVFNIELSKLGFENILVIGEPGTGKSSGQRTLEHQTNVWFNADNKNPVWEGGIQEYGKKTKPTMPYHVIPRTYNEILNHIKEGLKRGMFAENRYAFILGHVEQYKSGIDNKERLRTMGKIATKMQIEGKMETVLYSKVEVEGGKPSFILETQNNGFNTARSHQNMFEGKIPNDFDLILKKLSQI